ncbi:MAG TPA: cell division protein ZapA [Azospirillum sp.]|nr:cell division protein ZapA [Azospirillum sp.]
MARVEIEINGRPYQLACEDGQESRIRELAAYVDGRLKQVTGGGRSGSDTMMLVATCLVLADELSDALTGRAAPAPRVGPSPEEVAAEAAAVATVEAITRRIEEVAARLERA